MKNTTTLKGAPVALTGTFVTPGMQAPEFTLIDGDLKRFNLRDGAGKKLLLNIFPSIDTPTCAMSVRHFNASASKMHNTLVLCISKDLPFAQNRFCGAEGLKNVKTLSAFHDRCTFGKDYGVQIKSGALDGLFARAVVVINEEGLIIFSQLVDDIAKEPDYQRALEALHA
ncbi:MAG: thiol peroxidase [Victivallaceae bacterium]|nr:thiol peroxidase [Victivallaceae bacterium]